MCTSIVCFPVCDIIHCLSNQVVFPHDQKSRQKFNYSENEKSFSGKIKRIFHDGGPYHKETSPLICSATDFLLICYCMTGTFVMKELKSF